jgi:N-glycosylase/DNA lyase
VKQKPNEKLESVKRKHRTISDLKSHNEVCYLQSQSQLLTALAQMIKSKEATLFLS